MTNLYKTFDDSFKKDVIDLIKQGLKKELPTGAVYSASKKPPEGAREFTTDRGTKYWVPSKKDKEDKPKASSTPTREGSEVKRFLESDPKVENTKNGYQVMAYSPVVDKYIPKGQPHKSQEAAEKDAKSFELTPVEKVKVMRMWAKEAERQEKQAKPKASSTPKTGREQFTDKQRAELSNEVDISRKNLSVEAEELHLFTVNDADIYRQRETPIIDNLKKKMKKGVYERAKAEKLAKYMFDDASKKYDNSTSGHTFSPDERREAAAHWVKDFEDNYAFGEYD